MARRIVLCLDGTNNAPLTGRTNVSRFFRMLQKLPHEQVAYYQPGVGTLDPDDPGSRLWKSIRRSRDMGTAWMVERHVMSAYRYLMNEFESGDALSLVGFSRGAYVARILAGMLKKVGLLHRGHDEMRDSVWAIYQPAKNHEQAARFKKFFCRNVEIQFLGLWDTVRSVGTPWQPKVFANTLNNQNVKTVRHALALDERRVLYQANLWSRHPQHGQDVIEVWFPGVHADVGGGYTDDTDAGIGAIPLAWMVREAKVAGLTFDEEQERRLIWRKDRTAPVELSITAVTEEFVLDARHDEIAAHWYWRAAEKLPLPHWSLHTNDDAAADSENRERWQRRYSRHLSSPRFVPDHCFVHESVRVLASRNATYRPSNLPSIPRYIW